MTDPIDSGWSGYRVEHTEKRRLNTAHTRTGHPPVKQRPENLLLYLQQEGEKKRGQATEVYQSHKGNGLSPPDASASTVFAKAVRWCTTGETAHYRGGSIYTLFFRVLKASTSLFQKL